MKINYSNSCLTYEECVREAGNVEELIEIVNEIKNLRKKKHYIINLTSDEYSLTNTLDLTGILSPVTIIGYKEEGVKINSLGNIVANEPTKVKDKNNVISHNFRVYHTTGSGESTTTKVLKIQEWSNFNDYLHLDINENGSCISDNNNENSNIYTKIKESGVNSYLYYYTKWVARRIRITEVNENSVSFYENPVPQAVLGDKGFVRIVNYKENNEQYRDYIINNEGKYDFGNLNGVFRTGTLSTFIKISNSANITLENIVFSDNAIPYSDFIELSTKQAEIYPTRLTAAIEIDNSTNIKINKCKFHDLYGYCIGVNNRSSHIHITNNTINNTYGGGIQILNDCCYNTIDNNKIDNFGEYQPGCVGIIITNSHHNKITHNEILGGYYTGISLGWTWGYGESNCYANYVANNYIHNCMQKRLNDGAGIYTLGKSPGTVIENNLIHDIYSHKVFDSSGLYFDEGSSDIVARGNTIYNCNVGVHQHYGYNNELDNNLFFSIDYAILRFSKAEPHLSLYAHNNIFILNKDASTDNDDNKLMGGLFISKLYLPRYELSTNLICDTRENSCEIIEDDIYNHDYYLEQVDFKIIGDKEINLTKNYGKFIIKEDNEDATERTKKVYHFLVPRYKNIGIKREFN